MASVRLLSSVLLVGGLVFAAVGCGGDSESSLSGEGSSTSSPTPSSSFSSFGESWEEPASYVYTLTSSEGERSLIGTFRVTVRDGKVAKAVGLDESARGALKRAPEEVPTIRELLDQLARAHDEGADKAEAEYAPGGHPVRITLDPEENAADDEQSYLIRDYKAVPAPAGEQSS